MHAHKPDSSSHGIFFCVCTQSERSLAACALAITDLQSRAAVLSAQRARKELVARAEHASHALREPLDAWQDLEVCPRWRACVSALACARMFVCACVSVLCACVCALMCACMCVSVLCARARV